MSSTTFDTRRIYTREVLATFGEKLQAHLADDHGRVIGDHTTVYVTGSGGRGEMSPASDLDLFVVRATGNPSRLDAVVVQSSILRATRDCGIPLPSADGVFLEMHSADQFASMLGSQQDDAQNKFTARMLLLLESRPVLGAAIYDQIIEQMIGCYWSTALNHENDYLPLVFVNDVIRYWRVVLLNHESKLLAKRNELGKKPGGLDGEALDRQMKLERYARSVKLRFARCLTCFASLAYLLALTDRQGHVGREDMRAMVNMTPFERITAIVDMGQSDDVSATVEKMQELYLVFLEETAFSKAALMDRFQDFTLAGALTNKGSEFADAMFDLLHALGMPSGKKRNPLYRHMLV